MHTDIHGENGHASKLPLPAFIHDPTHRALVYNNLLFERLIVRLISKAVFSAYLLFGCVLASADSSLWDWSYLGSSTTASGTFSTIPSPGADGLVIGVTGVWGGQQIVGILPPGSFPESDNLLLGAVVVPSSRGISFSTSELQWVNISYTAGQIYASVKPADTSGFGDITDVSPFGSFMAAPRAVPLEPSDAAVLMGIIVLGARHIRRKTMAGALFNAKFGSAGP